MYLFTVKKLILFSSCLLFLSPYMFADKKKKTAAQYQKPNIIKRAWGDLTTRNNYYFNANELYKEVVHNYEFNRVINYNELLPFYYHDGADFSGNTADLETVAKKVGIVLQLHDYSRWRDNAFLLLGKSQFLRKQYDTSLITFQYIVTTMKPGKMNMQLEFSNKDRLKYLRKREKELAKKAGQKQKIIEFQYKKAQEEAEQKAEDAREKQQDAIAKKKKEIEEIIKAKKKIIELQKKGKKIPPELIAKAKGTSNKIDTTILNAKTTAKKQEKIDFNSNKPYILLGDKYVENPYYKDSTGNRDKQNPLGKLDPKKEAKLDKLTFWEKIKHKQSRPEAIVWMAKALIEQENYADARSIISYGKALRKLTKKQRRDLYLIDAYYNVRRNDYSPAIEELENAMAYFKKKKQRAYYEYLLAQLYQKNNQPADAVDYFVKAGKHTKTEDLMLFSKVQLAKLYSTHPDLAEDDVEKMLTKLIKMGRNKTYADQVLYTLANYYYYQKDTTQAIAALQKSIKRSIDNTEQKGKSFLRLGEIYFEKEMYDVAAIYYDSATALLPTTYPNYDKIAARKDILNDIAKNIAIIHTQDSLQRLGKMSPQELKNYLADIEAQRKKEAKKKDRFSNDIGNGNIGNALAFVPEEGISNGLWYFYNPEAKSKGYNDFKRIWGDRALEPNWRRSNKMPGFDDLITDNNNIFVEDTLTKKNNKDIDKNKTTVDSLPIPKTPEDFLASDKKIADALFGNGEIFKNKLDNLPKAKQYFDELIRRFQNSDYDAKAHYYQYLMYKENKLDGLAQKEKDYILQNYPLSDVAEVLNNLGNNKVEGVAETETAQSLYATTYQLFLNGNYDQVISNRFIAKTKYPSAPELPQFEFLEALSFGKKHQYDNYKTALSDIVLKYSDGAIKQKAQEYLLAYIQFETNLKDSTLKHTDIVNNAPTIVDTISNKFAVDTNTLWVLVRLKDQYLNVGTVIDKIKQFNDKHFKTIRLRVNPVFMESYAIIQIKKLEGITEANKYLNKIKEKSATIVGELNTDKVKYYIISSANFKFINKPDDLDIYEQYFNNNYPK